MTDPNPTEPEQRVTFACTVLRELTLYFPSNLQFILSSFFSAFCAFSRGNFLYSVPFCIANEHLPFSCRPKRVEELHCAKYDRHV
jgi:hypothetical protein